MGYYNSFILRVWTDGMATGIRGQIEHVRSREKSYFADEAQMHRFILGHLDPPTSDADEFDKTAGDYLIDDNTDVPPFAAG